MVIRGLLLHIFLAVIVCTVLSSPVVSMRAFSRLSISGFWSCGLPSMAAFFLADQDFGICI